MARIVSGDVSKEGGRSPNHLGRCVADVRPVLCLHVLSPDLLTLDTEDLHSNSTRGRSSIGDDLWCERGVAHDHIVAAGFGEHALSKVSR